MKKHSPETKKGVDYILITAVILLLLFGLVTLLQVLSDSFTGTEEDLKAVLSRLNTGFFNRQVGNILISLLVAIPLSLLDYDKYKPFIRLAYVANIGLLLLLILIGKTTRGIAGWFTIGEGGSIRGFQPSELCKVSMILLLSKEGAAAYDTHGKLRFFDVLLLTFLFALPFGLILWQPDFGTAMVLLFIFISILFCLKIHWGYILGAAAVSALSLPVLYYRFLTHDQKMRIRVFLDPTLDPAGDGYNVLHAKELIGSGGLFGKGYFSPGTLTQSGYVPERQTDFIFAGIVEGLGFVGGAVLIGLFLVVLWRFFVAAKNARDTFGRCICVGCSAMLGIHVIENIGMNIGLMPVTGIPLPLISYGGSNMLTTLMVVGMVLSVRYRSFHKGQI